MSIRIVQVNESGDFILNATIEALPYSEGTSEQFVAGFITKKPVPKFANVLPDGTDIVLPNNSTPSYTKIL